MLIRTFCRCELKFVLHLIFTKKKKPNYRSFYTRGCSTQWTNAGRMAAAVRAHEDERSTAAPCCYAARRTASRR